MSRPTAFTCFAASLFLLLVSLGCGPAVKPSVEPGPGIEPNAGAVPEKKVELVELDYPAIDALNASTKGKVVVVDYWSTACIPCIREFPKLVALDAKYDDDKLACISVSLDYYGGNTKVEEFREPVLEQLEKFGATFDNVLAADDTDVMIEKLKIDAPPAVFVFDRDGELARKFIENEETTVDYEVIGELVAELVAKE